MQEDRKVILDQTLKDDERSDLKQHADKMLRDFEKFNSNSSNRAIWELVQNACDLTTECNIKIDYRNDKFSFSHNGKPFVSKSLISLIKQVSGKYGEEEIEEVGKYGTGFLTTHTFGRKFIINSVLEAGELRLPISDFLIDRSPKEWQSLSDNISDQKRLVYKIIKEKSPVEFAENITTFTFLPETEKEFDYIKKSKIGLDKFIPLVLTINNRLKTVTIINEKGETIIYKYIEKIKIENVEDINLHQTVVAINNVEQHIYSIIDVDSDIEIILPINKDNEVFDFDATISRLFFYYPLIGSENFGLNFVINSKHFLPTEPRDGIHLKSDKDQVQDQEAKNREIIDNCSELIFKFLRSNVIEVKNPLFYTNVNFRTNTDDQFLNEYFKALQIKWNNNLQALPFVKTVEGFKPIEEAIYFSKDFLNQEGKIFDCFYELISKFYTNIPVKEDVLTWSEYANNWDSTSIKFIEHEDLLNKISEYKLEDFTDESLITYYQHLIDIDQAQVFNEYELTPNIEGDFNKMGYLLKAKDLNEQLIKLGKVLIPESIEKLIHPNFIFNFPLSPFNRRDFSDDVKNELDKKELTDSLFFSDAFEDKNYHIDLINSTDKIEKVYFKSLLDFCKLVNSTESSSKPNLLLKKISKYYGWEENLIQLTNVEEDSENIEYRSIRKVLVQIFCNLIALHNNEWVESHLDFVHKLCTLNDDSYKDVFKESKIYPNQLYELHLSVVLKRDLGVEEYIKDIYLKVKKDDVNEALSLEGFNQFIPEENYINNRYLTTIIEDILFEDDVINIDNHPYDKTIIDIIKKLTEKHYQSLFPQLNDKKASIMISVVSKEETKDDIFAIVTLEDDKLNSIGKLIKNPNFENILIQAVNSLEDDNQRKANFQFKHQIGTHIEKVLRARLENIVPDSINYEIKEEQNGQDIIIKIDDVAKYYIEVKSRWDARNSIQMSKNQTLCSYEEKEHYSLCSVDMTKYNGEDKYEIADFSKIIQNVRFVNDIGERVEHLTDVLYQTDRDNEIRLNGEYKTTVPQTIVNEKGMSLLEFEDYLVYLLKN